MKKSIIIYVLTIILSIVYLYAGNKFALKNYREFSSDEIPHHKAKVIEITEVSSEKDLGISDMEDVIIVFMKCKVLTGEKKGEIIDSTQHVYLSDPLPKREVQVGNTVLIMQSPYLGSEDEFVFEEFVRSDALIVLGAIFGICLIIFAGFKGVNTLFALLFSCLSIFLVFIPAILSGQNIYLWSIVTCLYIIFTTLILVSGTNIKSASAAIGCIGGVVFASILTIVVNRFINITGLVDEQSIYLFYLNEQNPIDLRAIVFGSILIGCIGAMLDVSVDIAAALAEVAEKMKDKTFKSIFASGMNIGKDTLGTMASTLVLAYIGSSLSMVLLLFADNKPLLYTMNFELIIVEILQSIIGSFGMLVTVPLTSLVCAYLYTRDMEEEPPIDFWDL